MADHGLTGTHHLDGSICTRDEHCPWSARQYELKLRSMGVAAPRKKGQVTNTGPGASQVITDQEVLDLLTKNGLDPASQSYASALHVANRWQLPITEAQTLVSRATVAQALAAPPTQTPTPAQQASLSQQITQAMVAPGGGSHRAAARPPGRHASQPPISPSPQGGPSVSTTPGTTASPITPAMIREDWATNPDLDETQKALLTTLPDRDVQAAIDAALLQTGADWFKVLRETAKGVTDALVPTLPNPGNPAEGAQDECKTCGLPLSGQGGVWVDAIMGSASCAGGSHVPREALDAIESAKKLASQGRVAPSVGGKGCYARCTFGEDMQDRMDSERLIGPFATYDAAHKLVEQLEAKRDTLGLSEDEFQFDVWDPSGPIFHDSVDLSNVTDEQSFSDAIWQD